MTSPASISSSNNMANPQGFSFRTLKPMPFLPSDFLVQNFCKLTVPSRNELAYTMRLHCLHGTGWNFPIKAGVGSTEFQKHALRVAVQVFDSKEDKNVQQVAKSSCIRMSKMERNPKRLSSGASERIEFDSYQVLKYPLRTELAMQEMLQHNTLVFVVDKNADKKNIKAAIKRICGVRNLQTKKVNTLVMPNGNKKAYITLKPNLTALDVAKKLGIIKD